MDKRTTDLDKIRKGEPFTWGAVTEIIDVGPYTILRYQSSDINRGEMFHGYVDGQDTHISSTSLDEILTQCIARKHEGLNSHAAHYFMRMIGAVSDWDK